MMLMAYLICAILINLELHSGYCKKPAKCLHLIYNTCLKLREIENITQVSLIPRHVTLAFSPLINACCVSPCNNNTLSLASFLPHFTPC